MNQRKKSAHEWNGLSIQPGEQVEVSLAVTESYSSLTIPIPIVVHRGDADGPTVFITAAIHGDEINGTGIIRSLLRDGELHLTRGTILYVPVVNILGFERHSRYLPDRRDLNRCFPGSANGSLAQRMAKILFEEIVQRCDYGIDLHTAAVRRTNFPNVRADMDKPDVAQLAEAFGCEVILNSRGPEGSLRREATRSGCATIILEAGEIWKVEPNVVNYGVAGILSALASLGMIEHPRREPAFRIVPEKTKWLRASRGGFLRFHVGPGDLISKGTPIATYTTLTGVATEQLESPEAGIVLGMTTLPCITPGDPICHLGIVPEEKLPRLQRRASRDENSLQAKVRDDLSTNMRVVEAEQMGSAAE